LMEMLLEKNSPLSKIYSQYPATYTKVANWRIAQHFGEKEREKDALNSGSVLVDWSHIGKVSLKGKNAKSQALHLYPTALKLRVFASWSSKDSAILRLADDEFLLLSQPGSEESILGTLEGDEISNVTGALGCFVLGGRERDRVIERSVETNVRRDLVPPGTVLPIVVGGIRCTLFRLSNFDIFLHPIDYSTSLFEIFVDVGKPNGMIPSGVATIPVGFELEGDN